MLGLATKKELKTQEKLTDYKIEVVYDYIDEVEKSVEDRFTEDIENIYDCIAVDREAVISSVMAIAIAAGIKPSAFAKIITTKNLAEYTQKVNEEIDKLKAQKSNAVKKNQLTKN